MIKKHGVNHSLLILLAMFICISPIYAVEDLSAYTQAGNYITPAYGRSLYTDSLINGYRYTTDGVAKWQITGDTFEYNGYYNTYDSTTHSVISDLVFINSSVVGEIFECVFDSNEHEYCVSQYNYTNVGIEENFLTLYNLALPIKNTAKGSFYHYYKFIHSGSTSYSYFYRGYYNINIAYANYIPISITGVDTFNKGVVSINLNSTLTNLISNDIVYDTDGNEQTYSGTYSRILITDSSFQKAYRYYIDNYKGGQYSNNRDSTNVSTIKIFVDENVNVADLYLFFNSTFYNHTSNYDGHFMDSTIRYDDNNNPYNIYQVFNDLRWNQSFYHRIFTQNETAYNRLTNVTYNTIALKSSYYKFKNNVSYIIINETGSEYGSPTYQWVYSTTYPIFKAKQAGGTDYCVRNSSNSELCGGYGASQFSPNIITLVGNIFPSCVLGYPFMLNNCPDYQYKITLKNERDEINITDKRIKLPINSLAVSSYDGLNNYTGYFRGILDKTNISSTNVFGNISGTIFDVNDSLLVADNGGDTFLNEFVIYPVVTTTNGGILSCYGKTNIDNYTIFGTYTIPVLAVSTVYNFIFQYNYSNKANFLNESLVTDYSYYCTFNSVTKSNTIIVDTNRIFVSNILPYNYYSTNTTPIYFNIKTEYGYGTSLLSTQLQITAGRLNCLSSYINGICYNIDYGIFSWQDTTTYNNPTNTNGYSNLQNISSCYEIIYSYTRNGTSDFTSRFICVNPNALNNTPLSPFDLSQKLNDSINSILAFGSGCSQTNQSCLRSALWANPLLAIDFLLMNVFDTVIIVSGGGVWVAQTINLLILLVGNFYTISLLLGALTLWKLEEHQFGDKLALIVTVGSFMFFSFMGWTGIPFLLEIAFIIACAMAVVLSKHD